ncbi:MAG: 50S ribosomal protein L5 [Pseudomonadales bacterium]|nr:50S ribosomal protein L5 [Candidatus Woesebacteria bacterium]MCB9801717.1 50S ribosomal protein L5 [Pseudomonadales bacterium]
MSSLKQLYQDTITPSMIKEFSYSSPFQVPRLQKIILNMGVSEPQDPRARKQVVQNIAEQFAVISGQKAQITTAHKAIANFKLRAGDPLGVMVTLRGERMWDFFEKLIAIALPRVKDFRGVSRTAFDGQGNYSMGLEEQIMFPEIDYDAIERVRSLQAVFVTTAQSDKESFRLLELFGVPFAKIQDR